MRRSPSPPTSASTLSSSFGGGSTKKTGGMAALHRQTPSAAASDPTGVGPRKDEWASELQLIPSGLEAVTGGGSRCGLGVGLEDWETMMSESAASPGQEQSLLRWMAGDVDDSSFGLKQLLQSGGGGGHTNQLDFDGNAGLGIVDQGLAFESGNQNLGFPGSGFASSNQNGNGKISSVTPSSSGHHSYKVSGPNIPNPIFSSAANNFPLPVSLPPGMMYHQFESTEKKPQIMNSQLLMNQHQQNQSLFMPF